MENLEGINISRVNKLDFKIPHRHWKNAFAEAFVMMTTAMPGEIISIYGPSRAGKSSLLRELAQTVVFPEHQDQDEQHLVQVEVDNCGGKASFSFKAFIADLLDEIKHPVYSRTNEDLWYSGVHNSRLGRATEATLANALIRGLKQRKTRYLIVDEAQDMKYAGKNAMAAAGVMDSLKTLANKANVVLVVCGTYPMLNSMNHSGHLENRKHDIHLPRYGNSKKDLEEFMWILSNYSAAMDLDESLPSLHDCAELIYAGSFGCIGLVRAWLYRASVLAAIEDRSVNLSHIQRSKKSAKQLVTVAQEILTGEKLLEEESFVAKEDEKPEKSKAKKKGRKKPFQRNAKRFPPDNRL